MNASDLASILAEIPQMQIPEEAIPGLLMALAAAQTAMAARLTTKIVTMCNSVAAVHDELLTVHEAAARMKVSADYLYRHSTKFPFTMRQGRMLRFSANGLDKYLKQRQGH